jgi:hypothetical protein
MQPGDIPARSAQVVSPRTVIIGFMVRENRMILNTVVGRRAVLARLASSSLGLLALHSEFLSGQSGEGQQNGPVYARFN